MSGAGLEPRRARVLVVGLGPAGPEHMSEAATSALAHADVALLRTVRHPAAAAFGQLASFDHHYEECDTFEEVYERIVEDLVEAAERASADGRAVLYAVPGSPLVGERTVALLRADPRVSLEVLPAMSFLDLAWEALGIDPVASGAQVLDASSFEVEAAGRHGPFLLAQCWSREVLSAVKLALDSDGPPPRVTVLHHLGLPDELVAEVALEDLDRSVEADHLTTLWIEGLAHPVGPEMARLAELVRVLRERCPWDREQTHDSLTRHLVEETYEVLDAIDEVSAPDASLEAIDHLEEELGDLLFQVMFHSRLAAEQGWFALGDVARAVHDKLVGRHPHVFGNVDASTPEVVMANWEVIKAAEKGRSSVTDGIPTALPSLLLAAKLQRKARSIGLDPREPAEEVAGALARVETERSAEALGDLLYDLVALSDALGVDAEAALRRAALAARDRIVIAERDAMGAAQAGD